VKQLNNLNRLYSLYNEINTYTRGIRDHLWVDVKFGDIVEVMSKFQSDAKKLPAEMRGWAAYVDLNQKIDNFVETMPFFEASLDPAVQEPH
jgi:hypothetical protein